ncbi:DNA polymerase IV [Phycisphaerales bacterium AB-hyl4]|uniref:DNA polymerase IV n=1 Tax=Natronomicrosphaera hydrolytica TaxID=3242702 RepID=A0ABV4U9D9_9BACT
MPTPRTILHVDMDAFFAAIAELDDPSLRGKAVLVGGSGPRGVVSTANYEARKFGCRSAMPMSIARRRCPHAIVAKVTGQRIRDMSRRLLDILEQTAPLVQPLSVDEAFLDVTGMDRLAGDGPSIARNLKQRIRDELQLTASVGVAFNKFLAKLASDMDKPDGLTIITPDNLDATLLPLPVDRLWGVGPRTLEKMHTLGLRTVADLRQFGLARLQRRFGHDAGEHYHRLALGRDDRPVVPDREAKSMSQEHTFAEDVADADHVRHVLLRQAEHVARRLRKHSRQARGVSVKIRFGDFQTITRSATLPAPTDLTDDLWHAAVELYDAWVSHNFAPVRLIGMGAERLSDTADQMTLFPDPAREKRQQLDQALDRIAHRFGETSIGRGAGTGERKHTHGKNNPWLEGA